MLVNSGCGESNDSGEYGVHINVDKYDDDLFDQAKNKLHFGCKIFSTFTFLVKLMHVNVLSR